MLDGLFYAEKDISKVPKQLHITPPIPSRYPAYFLAPYLNLKQAVQTVLGETWRRQQYAKAHSNDPPNVRAMSRITTAKHAKRKDRDEKAKAPDFHFTISGQVEALGLGGFIGRQHSGLDVSPVDSPLHCWISTALILRQQY